MNILYYGNCQLFAVKTILNLQYFVEKNIGCWCNDLDKVEFTNIIQQQDIIITQPINENYRDKDYLSTNYIINNCKENCKIIIFDSCYFNFYYFDLTYKWFNNEILHEPIDYHYNELIKCFTTDLPPENYIENYINNIELKTKEELEQYANQSLDDLNRRYNENVDKYKIKDNIFFISTYDFIKNNYKEKLLFYSMNHPTKYKYVIQYICEEIIKILNLENTILYEMNILDNPKSIIYKCLQKAVNFNINDYDPLVVGKTNVLDIVQLYYDTYKKIDFKE
jgi:hypothetical protein